MIDIIFLLSLIIFVRILMISFRLQLSKLFPPRAPQFSDFPTREGLSQLLAPVDDVWIEQYYPIKTYTVGERVT